MSAYKQTNTYGPEKENYRMRFLSGTRNERKPAQFISSSKFLKAINKAIIRQCHRSE